MDLLGVESRLAICSVIMTDKNINERDILARFSDSDLQICLFHTFRTFSVSKWQIEISYMYLITFHLKNFFLIFQVLWD